MIRKMINQSNKRRLVRFNLLRQQLCPICGNLVCFDNSQQVYKCKDVNCSFSETKNNASSTEEKSVIEKQILNSL